MESPAHAPARTALVLGDVRIGQGDARRTVPGRLRVTWREPDRDFLPGDRVTVTGRVHPPTGTSNPGGFDYGAYLRQQGIDTVISVSGSGRVTLVEMPDDISRWTLWRMVEEWRSRSPGVDVALSFDGDLEQLGEAINMLTYRVVQESLTNVAKHAAARRVSVGIARDVASSAGTLNIDIVDDGRGAPAHTDGKGLGLIGMRERVASVGGEICISSPQGQGTRIHVTLPILGHPEK